MKKLLSGFGSMTFNVILPFSRCVRRRKEVGTGYEGDQRLFFNMLQEAISSSKQEILAQSLGRRSKLEVFI